ncbi:hypothetical protein D4764_0018240 [Takifugu flavidus]|uniref:Uncharacterized protein n=1 Tax=Takifugu flavidus TaxID=433684 RepID=A0A5C6MIK3_9TELE|nr:hypothetical protein D4764_0018240 [Takifugu flavidus]
MTLMFVVCVSENNTAVTSDTITCVAQQLDVRALNHCHVAPVVMMMMMMLLLKLEVMKTFLLGCLSSLILFSNKASQSGHQPSLLHICL